MRDVALRSPDETTSCHLALHSETRLCVLHRKVMKVSALVRLSRSKCQARLLLPSILLLDMPRFELGRIDAGSSQSLY